MLLADPRDSRRVGVDRRHRDALLSRASGKRKRKKHRSQTRKFEAVGAFRRITLPLIVPALVTMSMLSLIATFNSFDIIWILTQGGPNGQTTAMIIDTYKTAIGSYKYGEGAARAVMICLFLSVFCFFYFRVVSKISTGEAK